MADRFEIVKDHGGDFSGSWVVKLRGTTFLPWERQSRYTDFPNSTQIRRPLVVLLQKNKSAIEVPLLSAYFHKNTLIIKNVRFKPIKTYLDTYLLPNKRTAPEI